MKQKDNIEFYQATAISCQIQWERVESIALPFFCFNHGFIATRNDGKTGQTEAYTYDNLDRLTSYTVNGATATTFDYNSIGNITSNSRVGTYSYGNSKPHAVMGIAGNAACPIPASQCDVSYNLHNKPASIAENGYRITLDYDAAGMRRHTRYYQGNVMKKTTAKISDVHEVELATGLNRKLDYIFAEGQIVAVHVKNGMSDSLYYVLTDHLGNWNMVVDENKNIVQQTHFDPWGNRMSHTSWNTPQTQTSFCFNRGFTGHEHYDRFKIINANARLYDPVIGRFFSPDPFVQTPDFTQNYNRYSYCMNNPVMFTDPDGEFFIFDSWINGFIHGFATASENRWAAAWDEANKRAVNDARIWGGLFVSDPNKNFWGRSLEVVSRLTWQLPQTVAGWGFSQSCNTLGIYGGVETVEYRYGATVVQTNSNNWGAVTLGGYITGNNSIRADANNPLFQHEYGHYLQSREMGWAYFARVGMPSFMSAAFYEDGCHDFQPFEQDANRRAFLYFNKHVDGFYKTREEHYYNYAHGTIKGWDFSSNPLDVYHTTSRNEYYDYNDTEDLKLINGLTLHSRWYDYIFVFGIGNGIYYMNNRIK